MIEEEIHMMIEEQRKKAHMREAEEWHRAKELREARGQSFIGRHITRRILRFVYVSRESRKQQQIPQAAALALCKKIQRKNRMPLARWRCRRCIAHGQNGLPTRLAAASNGCCDCSAVNRRYLKRTIQKSF